MEPGTKLNPTVKVRSADTQSDLFQNKSWQEKLVLSPSEDPQPQIDPEGIAIIICVNG